MSPFLAASGIYRVRQMFNLMLESVLRFDELVDGDRHEPRRETAFILSPGFRGGWNIGEQQLIVGAAVPITWVDGDTEPGLLLYLVVRAAVQEGAIEVAPRLGHGSATENTDITDAQRDLSGHRWQLPEVARILCVLCVLCG